MPPRAKALISWSSGKDSAFALHEIRRAGGFDVVGALTTVTETFGRVSIHGVRQEILHAQLDAAGLQPTIVPIPYPCPNEIYEARMGEAVASAMQEGPTSSSATCFLKISEAIASRSWPAPASPRCFPCGDGRRWSWRMR
jgi:hypothetical protein